MKKYSDWQRYVKEQIDRMNDPSAEPESTAPTRAVPSIDKEKFTIHRKTQQPETAEAKQPAAPPQPKQTYPNAPFWNPQPHAAAPQSAPEQPPAIPVRTEPVQPLASPFVSVHDVWKEAEKPQKTAAPPQARMSPAAAPAKPAVPPQQHPTAPPPRAAVTPRAQQQTVVRPPAPVVIDEPSLKNPKDETREEILERLINPTISLEEAAKIMGVCKATVRRYTAMGILPHYRTPGNQRRFKLNDIILFLENQKRQ